MLGYCVGFVAARSFIAWIFPLLGSCSLELLLLAVNLEMDNSLKWILFNIVSGQITPLISPALVEWKAQANVNGLNFI